MTAGKNNNLLSDLKIDLEKFKRRSDDPSVKDQSSGKEPARKEDVSNIVEQVVADLDSLLGFIISMRCGLQGTNPCDYESIASQINRDMKPSLRKKIADLLGEDCAEHPLTAKHIEELEARAQRALCRRKIAQ